MPWNRGEHRRKFMVTSGSYRDDGTTVSDGQVTFWGEWEGPSLVTRSWRRQPPLPSFLHEPYFEKPTFAGPRQNTDPWVFGKAFRYSNCRQRTNHGHSVTRMQGLTAGSLVFFGSKVLGRFVIDTVFVVGQRVRQYTVGPCPEEPDEAFRVSTLESLCSGDDPTLCGSGPENPARTFTLFQGATPQDPIDGMFSFVPALPHDPDGSRFARPRIDLPGIINPENGRAFGITFASLDEVRDAWDSAVRQVLDQDLVLATRLELPHGRPGDP